jgi:hypothetical protein
MNRDKHLAAPCPARAQRACVSASVSLPGAARIGAAGARPDAGSITAPSAAFGTLACQLPLACLHRPAWAVLAGRILALVCWLRPAALPLPQAPRLQVGAHARPLSST